MKHSSFLLEKVMNVLLGVVKEHQEKRLHMQILLDQFFALETNSLSLRKVKKLKNSGLPLEEKLSIVRSKAWVLLQDLSQDYSNAVIVQVTS